MDGAPRKAAVRTRARGRTRGARAGAAGAALLLGAGAAAGCAVQDGAGGKADGSPIRISQAPTQTPAERTPHSSPPASPVTKPTSATPRPERSTPTGPPRTARPAAHPVLMRSGAEGPRVRELQARLRQLKLFDRNPTGYYGSVTADSVRAFQRQQGLTRTGTVTDTVWSALRARTHAPSRSELRPPTSLPLDDPDPRCMTGRVLCVSKESRTLAWMVDGKVRSAMDVRFGSAYTPTREGEFKVDFKSRRHHSTIYDTPMPYALFFSRGQAIHYSADFAARGYTGASHGCVNVRDKKKIAALFDTVKPGDKVVVYK
ncbi:L,D-transpeptidase family protein [Streptomyces sp. NPDC048172]|uniref:L,D-transpeptidase family protein n=1 Tax=Streptomyces sp. NPDC048172 TaxID=3365505 RepID=UPI00371F035B